MALDVPVVSPGYRDTKTRLVLVGVFELILGGLAVLLLGVTMLGRLVAPARAEQPSVLPAVFVFVAVASVLVTLGIGSLCARRWARAIGLCLGWAGLVGGIVAVGVMIWMLPHFGEMMRTQAEAAGRPMPQSAVTVAAVAIVGMTGFMYVVVPTILVACYSGENVRRTCEVRDPLPRWTDRVPLPVLAMVLLQAAPAVTMLLSTLGYGRAMMVFGALVTGPLSVAVYLLVATVFAYAAIGFYRLSPRAYWVYLAAMVLFAVNGWLSFGGDGLMRVYRALEMPPAQLDALAKSPLVASGVMRLLAVAGSVVMIGWLVWLRRYFPNSADTKGESVIRSTP